MGGEDAREKQDQMIAEKKARIGLVTDRGLEAYETIEALKLSGIDINSMPNGITARV